MFFGGASAEVPSRGRVPDTRPTSPVAIRKQNENVEYTRARRAVVNCVAFEQTPVVVPGLPVVPTCYSLLVRRFGDYYRPRTIDARPRASLPSINRTISVVRA